MRRPGKVTLPTAHYSHRKNSPKKTHRKYAKRPTEISLTTWAEMISGQARESWDSSIVMVFACFISASIIIVWVTSLALVALQSELAVDQHTSKSINSCNPQTLNGEPSSYVPQEVILVGFIVVSDLPWKPWKNHLKAPVKSKHFRGIFNTSRSFSQKAAFLLQANGSDILCLRRACSQSARSQ